MRCRFLTRDKKCLGKYQGYACIGKHCSSFREAVTCEHHDTSGDYCRKYGRFGCVGVDSCQTLSDYLEAVAEEEGA